MKKLILTLSLVVFLFSFVGCKEDDGEPKETPSELTSLIGTKWKLVGFFDIEKDKLIEPMAKDCDSCYTISFQWDSIVSLPSQYETETQYFTSASGLMVDMPRATAYNIDYQTSTLEVIQSFYVAMEDNLDGDRLFYALRLAERFELKYYELKLYYTDYDYESPKGAPKKPFYLLFKRIDL